MKIALGSAALLAGLRFLTAVLDLLNARDESRFESMFSYPYPNLRDHDRARAGFLAVVARVLKNEARASEKRGAP